MNVSEMNSVPLRSDAGKEAAPVKANSTMFPPTRFSPPSALPTAPNSIPITELRTKRFRLNDAFDIALCKAVSTSNAHRAPSGKKGAHFAEAHSFFLSTVPPVYLSDREPPTQKGNEDRFKMLIGKRRIEVKKTAAASGIVEEHGEKEMLLDDLILEMEDKIEQGKEKKGKRLEKEQKLKEAGEELRDLALKRSNTYGGTSADHISPGAKISSRRIAHDSDEDTTEAFVKDMKHRRDQEDRRFK